MRSRKAGALRVGVGERTPPWLDRPSNPNALVRSLWADNVGTSADGVLSAAGVEAPDLAAEIGTPLYVIDEADFRGRARAFKQAILGADVYYAGKAFLCVASVRWIDEESLILDVCSGGELAVALRAGFDPARIEFHGNNKSRSELKRAVDVGVGRLIVDSHSEIRQLAAIASERQMRQDVLLRVTTGVDALTHEYIATAHEDQKFGFSLADGQALRAMREIATHESLALIGLHSHIGSQIFDTSGFEVATRRVLALYAAALRLSLELRELNLGGGFGIAYTTQDAPASPSTLAAELLSIVGREYPSCRRCLQGRCCHGGCPQRDRRRSSASGRGLR